MKILALDTSTEACTAALLIDGTVSERYQVAPREHSRLILPMLQSLLDEAGLCLAQIDALAYGCGPGAFTGVRLSVSVAQGVAFGADLPVVAVSTLAALAQGALCHSQAGTIVPVIDARMHEVYWAVYRRRQDGLVALAGREQLGRPTEVVLPVEEAWYGVGSGWDTYHEILCREERASACNWQRQCFPHAGDIARLGAWFYRQGNTTRPEEAAPVYLRNQVTTTTGHTR